MNILQNIKQFFAKGEIKNQITKAFTNLAGLPTLSAGEWSEEKYLETYDKSLDVFACVKKISAKIASIEYKLFRIKNSKGELEQILAHPLLDLLANPSPFVSKAKLIKLKEINELLTGDGYWYKAMVGNTVAELWNLRPDWIKIIPSSTDYIKEYIYRIPGQKELHFTPEEVIHFNEPSPLKEFADRTGQSPIRPAQVRVDTEEFATKFQRDFFHNNARLDAVLQSDQPLNKDRIGEIRDQWSKKYKGVGKNSKIGILQSGLKYVQISTAQKDMDYISGLKATRDDIFMAFEMPKSVIGIAEDVNRANADAAMASFLTENIKPKMRDFVDTLNQSLVPHFGKGLILDFVDPSPENVEEKLKIYENASKNGWMTQNEIREKEGLMPLKTGGDEPLANSKISSIVGLSGAVPQKRTVILGQVVQLGIFEGRKELFNDIRIKELKDKIGKQYKKKASKEKKELDELKQEKKKTIWRTYLADRDRRKNILLPVVRKFLIDQEKRLFRIINEKDYKYEANYKKHIKKALLDFDWEMENERLIAAITPSELKILKISGKAALARVGVSKPFISEGFIGIWLQNQIKVDSSLINKTTRTKLSKQYYEALANGEGINEIKERVKNVYKIRGDAEAVRIARTQTGAIINEASVEAYKQSGVVKKKEWIATMDDRVRPEHAAADGQIVDVDKPFEVGGVLMNAPSQINCRCATAPFIE